MFVKRLIVLLLLPFCCAFGNVDLNVVHHDFDYFNVVNFDVVADKFPQLQTVNQKLETAHVAYYGVRVERVLYSVEDKQKLELNLTEKYPSVYKAFVGWADYKQKKQNELLKQAPEKIRQMFEFRKNTMVQHGYFLAHDLILVEKIYDKDTKTWVSPKPEESRKSLFYMAYVGPEVSKDSSSWKISQRLMNRFWEKGDYFFDSTGVKRIFFLDGFSERCDFLMNSPSLQKLRYYPIRLKYDALAYSVFEIRKKVWDYLENENYVAADALADSADLSPRMKVLLKFLTYNRDFISNEDSVSNYRNEYNYIPYNDGLDSLLNAIVKIKFFEEKYCDSITVLLKKDKAQVREMLNWIAMKNLPEPLFSAESGFRLFAGSDVGHSFLIGDFPEIDPSWFFGFNFGLYLNDFVLGLDFRCADYQFKNSEHDCDSCMMVDYSARVSIGVSLLKMKYLEGVVFANLGASRFSVKTYQNEIGEQNLRRDYYVDYGVGGYIDALFPNYLWKPSRGNNLTFRYGARLKFGINNMDLSDIGYGSGYSPYVSLGFTAHLVKMQSSTSKVNSHRSRIDYVDVD